MKIIRTYYISTGALEAMHTLRVLTASENFSHDHFIRILSSAKNPEMAIEKAKNWIDRIGGEYDNENSQVRFGGIWDEPTNERVGKLSVRDTHNLQIIEDGKFPFGKHNGTLIEDAPESYVLFFADKVSTATDAVTFALASACHAIAADRGYYDKRQAIRDENLIKDMKSNHIGNVGDRIDFEGEVFLAFNKTTGYGDSYWINKIRQNDDIIVYIGGKALGEVGSIIKFKGTVKSHSSYQEVRSTVISRPKLV